MARPSTTRKKPKLVECRVRVDEDLNNIYANAAEARGVGKRVLVEAAMEAYKSQLYRGLPK